MVQQGRLRERADAEEMRADVVEMMYDLGRNFRHICFDVQLHAAIAVKNGSERDCLVRLVDDEFCERVQDCRTDTV